METFITLFLLFISWTLINNVQLHYFVGTCPFLGVSKRVGTAFGMGMAVTFVLVIAATLSWIFTAYILRPQAPLPQFVWELAGGSGAAPLDLSVLSYLLYIFVIAASVQFVEMYVRKNFPSLYQAFGVYLPLITTNCAILFICLEIYKRLQDPLKLLSFPEALTMAVAAGLGFAIAITLMAGIREELELADVPKPLRGPGIALLVAGILAMAFMGFAGVEGGVERALSVLK